MLRACRRVVQRHWLCVRDAGCSRAESTSAPAQRAQTVFALSSGAGRGAVAVIRVSGPAAYAAAVEMLAPGGCSLPPVRRAALRSLWHPVTREKLDDALVLTWRAPHSFTGEDVVEFHVHAGPAVIAGVIQALTACRAPLRPADPGEFTRQAYHNERLDLTKVEALADLLAAETAMQRRAALRQADGELARALSAWRTSLLTSLAHTEAVIDFGEDEEISDDVIANVVPSVVQVKQQISACLQDPRRGEAIRAGLQAVLIGPPNAGKSSLFNRLVQRPAAIVSDVPGTTRDVMDVTLDLGGYPLVLSDTAGIRDISTQSSSLSSHAEIEAQGIERAQQRAATSDVIIGVFDAQEWPRQSQQPAFASLLQQVETGDALLVLNKVDMLGCSSEAALPRPRGTLLVSCTHDQGLDALVSRLQQHVAARFHASTSELPILTRQRHRAHLQECLDHLAAYQRHVSGAVELACEDLRLATSAIARITGRFDAEDVLDIVFADFCIGK